MAVKTRTKRLDANLKQIVEVLRSYAASHPNSDIEAYRHDSVSVRVRIVDPDFERKSRSDREEEIWGLLDQLPEEIASEISLLLLLTPKEAQKSFASDDFDNPIPSKL
jgi:hypothetical protein